LGGEDNVDVRRVIELVEAAKNDGRDLYEFAFEVMNEQREQAATIVEMAGRADLALIIRSS
jgi:hypothetical protein